MSTVIETLMEAFDSHQRLNVDNQVKRSSFHGSATTSNSSTTSVSSLIHSLLASVHDDSNQVQQDIAGGLEQIVNALLANLVKEDISTVAQLRSCNLQESITNIMKFCAEFTCAQGDGSLSTIAIDQMGQFANVPVESIRAVVLDFMNMCLTHLLALSVKSTTPKGDDYDPCAFLTGHGNDMEQELEWRKECIGLIKEILIPRLQDKSQAVRSLAIDTSATLFHEMQHEGVLSSAFYHQDLVEALLWNMRHDPSFANRSLALKAIPVNPTTIPDIVERVRDSKLKVRVDALDILRTRVNVHDLTTVQRVQILQVGLSKRYPATLVAASKLLCCGWMKAMKFDPIQTIALLDPIANDEISILALKIIFAVASEDYANQESFGDTAFDTILEDLSAPEIRAFKEEVLNRNVSIAKQGCELSAPHLLFVYAMSDLVQESASLSDGKKASRLSDVVPDVTVLCDVLSSNMTILQGILNDIDEMEDDDEAYEEYETKEEAATFVCLYLLKLSKIVDLSEEGSRRHFASILHSILCDVKTHEDLIEGCVQALYASHDSEGSFLLSISEILASFIPSEDDTTISKNEKRSQYLRGISILSVSFEKVSRKMSSNPILEIFSSIILISITDSSLGNLVREAGVSCLGRFVILMEENVIMANFKPLLMEIAYSEEERVEIRAQAVLAITDLTMLFPRFLAPTSIASCKKENVTVTDLLLHALLFNDASLSIVAAECAAKLLLNGKIHDSNLVGHLLVMYYDKDLSITEIEEDNETDAIKEVGNPTRLHQLLTLFFPAYSMSSKIARDTLTSSFRPTLDIIHKKMTIKKRGSKNTNVWPIAKMVDYMCQVVEQGESSQEAENSREEIDSSPLLLATIAICEFILEKVDNMTVTHLRSLCKILNKTYIDVKSEDKDSLKLLKRYVGDLYDTIDDSSASRSIEPLVVLLDDIIDEENDQDESSKTLGLDDSTISNVEDAKETKVGGMPSEQNDLSGNESDSVLSESSDFGCGDDSD
jgi:condensin complex subunit 3